MNNAIKRQRAFTWIHKWIGLAIGIQVTIWVASGLVMVLYDIEAVRGEHRAERGYSGPVVTDGVIPVTQALAAYDGEARSITLRPSAGRALYRIEGSAGEVLLNAQTGTEAAALGEADIRSLAAKAYKGEAEIGAARLLTEAPIEWRSYVPVWQVEFDDGAATRLYLNPVTGDVETVRTRLWRVYDIAWMLHIMDYRTRTDFNNWLVKLSSGLGLAVSLSGLILLFYRLFKPWWTRRRFRRGGGVRARNERERQPDTRTEPQGGPR